mmetsp:Transcript_56751/g.112107  ORF Transcript_56751/g.112107 Transcript_56751/m.112107 type:complete len:122 (-) Transcript_56751:229-594(-)
MAEFSTKEEIVTGLETLFDLQPGESTFYFCSSDVPLTFRWDGASLTHECRTAEYGSSVLSWQKKTAAVNHSDEPIGKRERDVPSTPEKLSTTVELPQRTPKKTKKKAKFKRKHKQATTKTK